MMTPSEPKANPSPRPCSNFPQNLLTRQTDRKSNLVGTGNNSRGNNIYLLGLKQCAHEIWVFNVHQNCHFFVWKMSTAFALPAWIVCFSCCKGCQRSPQAISSLYREPCNPPSGDMTIVLFWVTWHNAIWVQIVQAQIAFIAGLP